MILLKISEGKALLFYANSWTLNWMRFSKQGKPVTLPFSIYGMHMFFIVVFFILVSQVGTEHLMLHFSWSFPNCPNIKIALCSSIFPYNPPAQVVGACRLKGNHTISNHRLDVAMQAQDLANACPRHHNSVLSALPLNTRDAVSSFSSQKGMRTINYWKMCNCKLLHLYYHERSKRPVTTVVSISFSKFALKGLPLNSAM